MSTCCQISTKKRHVNQIRQWSLTVTFKFENPQFMTKVNPSNRNEVKSYMFSWEMSKSDIISFLSKNIKAFQWLSKSVFLSFLNKANPKTEMKSTIFKSNIIYFLSKNIKVFQWISKSKFLSFMTKGNPSNETDIFHWSYWNLTSFFIVHEILNHFNDFYDWHF